MTENKELSKSIEVLKIALQADKSNGSYYHSWQASIAMAFLDTIEEYVKAGELEIKPNASFVMSDLCNDAAKRFLELLINNNKA